MRHLTLMLSAGMLLFCSLNSPWFHCHDHIKRASNSSQGVENCLKHALLIAELHFVNTSVEVCLCGRVWCQVRLRYDRF